MSGKGQQTQNLLPEKIKLKDEETFRSLGYVCAGASMLKRMQLKIPPQKRQIAHHIRSERLQTHQDHVLRQRAGIDPRRCFGGGAKLQRYPDVQDRQGVRRDHGFQAPDHQLRPRDEES